MGQRILALLSRDIGMLKSQTTRIREVLGIYIQSLTWPAPNLLQIGYVRHDIRAIYAKCLLSEISIPNQRYDFFSENQLGMRKPHGSSTSIFVYKVRSRVCAGPVATRLSILVVACWWYSHASYSPYGFASVSDHLFNGTTRSSM
jgi:hypothetical protein